MQQLGNVVVHIFHLSDCKHSDIDPIETVLISWVARSLFDQKPQLAANRLKSRIAGVFDFECIDRSHALPKELNSLLASHPITPSTHNFCDLRAEQTTLNVNL
jgi:hypothetical protein